MVSELKFTKKQIKEFLGGLMSLNCTNGVCILYILFLWTCIFQDFYRILQVIASTNLREIKKILLNCLLLVALVGLFPRLAAQNITFKHLSTDNGLSQISVNDIYVDENNLIWIGTREGLNCYDGNDITIYDGLVKDAPDYIFKYGEIFSVVTYEDLNLIDGIISRKNFNLLNNKNTYRKEVKYLCGQK